VKNFLLPALSFSIFREPLCSSPASSFVTIMLPPTSIRKAIILIQQMLFEMRVFDFAKSEGYSYVVNHRDLDKKEVG
jgi:hypothetical protein